MVLSCRSARVGETELESMGRGSPGLTIVAPPVLASGLSSVDLTVSILRGNILFFRSRQILEMTSWY